MGPFVLKSDRHSLVTLFSMTVVRLTSSPQQFATTADIPSFSIAAKCKSTVDTVKAVTLACVVLHNLCIERGDVNLRHWDITLDPVARGGVGG